MHINSHLQASFAQYEAIKLIRKNDRDKDGLYIPSSQASVEFGKGEFGKERTPSRIPKANNKILPKLGSNPLIKLKDQLEGKTKNSSTRVLLEMPLSREQMKQIFKQHDSNNDGFLNIWEITKVFAFLGSIIPFNKAHYGLALADANKDGLISEVELDQLIDYASKVMKKK